MKIDPTVGWMRERHPAWHWEKADAGNHVVCKLSPRNCRIADGHMGHCGVRGNVDGELFSFNYGKSVEATMEFIETEAVYHYRPGARILSLGNIGCMMSCDFCQNWRTSQARHLDPREVRHYTPEEVVEACKITGISVISWTYNDPVVWQEFVVETSRLAQANGIVTLYKSAFYIEPAAVDELIGCIDIFSISLKSMEDRFYRKFTGGARLQPVLDMIERVHASDRHLEISQLLITGRNDCAEEIAKTNHWVLEHLGDRVPLHYVAFHPAYLYVDTVRTRPETLLMAREMATEAGIRHCYIGNMFRAGVADTHCGGCGRLLVSRYGLQARVVGIDHAGCCVDCGTTSDICDPLGGVAGQEVTLDRDPSAQKWEFRWNAEAQSVHIEVCRQTDGACPIVVERLGVDSTQHRIYVLGGILRRVIVSKQADTEIGIVVFAPGYAEVQFFPVLDRAHFPTSTDLARELAGYRNNSSNPVGRAESVPEASARSASAQKSLLKVAAVEGSED